MDTKLKNRHRISALISILLVIAAAVIMVGLYPFFEKEAGRHEEPAYEEQAFLRHLVFGNYVLYLEHAQYEAGTVISPFELFFPEADAELKGEKAKNGSEVEGEGGQQSGELSELHEDYLQNGGTLEDGEPMRAGEAPAEAEIDAAAAAKERQEYLRQLRQSCVLEYETWNRYFSSLRNVIDYQVLDENGEILLNHAGERNLLSSDDYVFKAVMHYDSIGRMDVTQLTGEDTTHLLKFLQAFGEIDPMKGSYWDSYSYETSLKLQNPKNLIFAYGMQESQLASYGQMRSGSWQSYYNSGTVTMVFIGLACFVALAVFIIACLDGKLADDNKILRAPFELVLGVGIGSVAFGVGLTSLVAVTNQGDLYNALIRANFLPGVADILVKAWNVFWWSVPFAVISWAVMCLRDVFHIGLRRYIRERTLIGWIWGGCVWICRTVYQFIYSIDLQDKSDRTIFKIIGINFLILTVLCSLWFFGIGALLIYSAILFLVLRKYYHDLRSKYSILLDATNQIAEGNLDVMIAEDLGVFEPFKCEIQRIQSGFKVAVDEEVKSQKMKTDLITNMSHDLKTPLTAIITYVNLLKDENITPEQRRAYIDVLEQKSMRLKSLIEDLFEISKANSNDVTLNLVNVDIVSLLKEVSLELSDKIEESTIDFRWNLPDEKIVLPLDSQKTYRIFDNLLTNIIKYGMPNTRAYIDMKREQDCVVITMKNVSANELTFNPEEITERFVRGDQARNTEGSGLGMAIAKSFVELQNGKMNVEVEADLFRVNIRWPIQEQEEV